MYGRYLIDFDTSKIDAIHTDFLIIGSGIAGLYTALKLSKYGNVAILTKRVLNDSNTYNAQGGIAAVIGENDSPDLHYKDTIQAGAGLCNHEAVKVLATEGTERIREIIDMGVNFDRDGERLALTKEGAHSLSRILHARGDATGKEIVNGLMKPVVSRDNITIYENMHVIDIFTEGQICLGALAMETKTSKLISFIAGATIAACGGAGRLYKETTNPVGATGDGYAFCYRAGAKLMDMELIQFHPTAFSTNNDGCFLISEAVRGEGAILRNIRGENFMEKYHELGGLAPRDVVARAILIEIDKTCSKQVYLDLTHFPEKRLQERFPTIMEKCNEHGIDISRDYIPVVPAAHYMMGGVQTDLFGRTNIQGLYACGETAATGVHGANRLASNSLLEALVFGHRIVLDISSKNIKAKKELPHIIGNNNLTQGKCNTGEIRERLQTLMMDNVGIIRSIDGLQRALDELESIVKETSVKFEERGGTELQNMIMTAIVVVKSALLRKESRGSHYLKEYPQVKTDECDFHTIMNKNMECINS